MLQITRRMQSHWMKKQVCISLDRFFPLLPKCKTKGRRWIYTGSVYQHYLIKSPLNEEDSPPQGPHDKKRSSKKVTAALDLLCVIGQLSGIPKEKNWYPHLKPMALPTALLN